MRAVRALALALALFAHPRACAAEGALRFLSDPAYLPWKGQLEGISSCLYGGTQESVQNNQMPFSETKGFATQEWVQSFTYGALDSLALRLSDTLAWGQETTAPSSGAASTTSSQGPTDPTVEATWRVVEQGLDNFDWDWIASYAPNLFEDVAASNTRTGSEARGGQFATLATALSSVTRDFTCYFEGEAAYVGSRDIVNANDTVTNYAAYPQGTLEFNTQTRFTDRLSLNAGVTGVWNGNADARNRNTGLAFVAEYGDAWEANLALNFQMLPRVLAASLTGTYELYAPSSNVYASRPASNSTIQSEDTDEFGLRLEYVFF